MWHTYYAPDTVSEALVLLAQHGDSCRLMAGGTDLILEMERGVRDQKILIDISRVPGLERIEADGGALRLGAAVTHNEVVSSPDAAAHAFPLARACWLVGAPQIRNRGTVAGNTVTASPANDTITPLWAMDATFTLVSLQRGERVLNCDQFFLGVRRTALAPDEMLVGITVPLLRPTERGTFLKLGLRQAQAISVVNVAVIVEFDAAVQEAGAGQALLTPARKSPVVRARIALGAVAPTIVRATEAEAWLAGKALDDGTIGRAAELAAAVAKPISDIRGSADYRRDMVRVLTARALNQLRDGTEREGWPARPVLLWGSRVHNTEKMQLAPQHAHDEVSFSLNGRPITLYGVGGKTLLRALREDVGLIGTKEGCAEGECGACTVWLDGVAVMSCLVPVERAEGCEVTTVEGLATAGTEDRPPNLHPLQQAFIDAGAVQCGYCTPGILMSAASLLEEVARPTPQQIRESLTGNLCRCTGYYKIVEAIEQASQI